MPSCIHRCRQGVYSLPHLGVDHLALGLCCFYFCFICDSQVGMTIEWAVSLYQAVYGVLKEAEHRSTFYIPYWNIPITRWIVPRQRQFHADLAVINQCLDDLIAGAKRTRQADDVEALQARDYSKVLPSLHPIFLILSNSCGERLQPSLTPCSSHVCACALSLQQSGSD